MAAIDKTHVLVLDVEGAEGGRRSFAGNGLSDAGANRSDEGRRGSTESRTTEIVEKVGSPVSECSVDLDLECGVLEPEVKAHLAKVERDCRICHLSLDTTNHESGIPIELGCSCKDDLAAAHKQCAEAWFKIKGNK